MDSQVFMSVTADVQVGEAVTLAPPWACFAPFMEKDYIRELIQKSVFKPRVSLRSQSIEGAELRIHLEDRLGVAGLVKEGEVQVAYPFAQFGRKDLFYTRQASVAVGRLTVTWPGKSGASRSRAAPGRP